MKRKISSIRSMGLAKKLVILLGVSLIPLIYSGLLISSIFDPTHNLAAVPAAIVNHDQAATPNASDTSINLGKEITSELVSSTSNTNLHWVEMSQDQAQEALENGSVYAVLDIPENFTANTVSIANDDPSTARPAQLTITSNDGSNVVMGSITSSIGKTLENKLDSRIAKEYLNNIYAGFNTVHDNLTQAADGAHQLKDGTTSAHNGSLKLSSGLNELAGGASDLAGGTHQLKDGIHQADDGAHKLSNGASDAHQGSADLADGAQQTSTGASTLASGLSQLNIKLSETPTQTKQLTDGADALAQGTHRAHEGAQQLTDGLAHISNKVSGPGDQTLTKGATDLESGAHQLASGADTLAGGAASVADGAHRASEGANKLSEGANKLAFGAVALNEGALIVDRGAKDLLANWDSLTDEERKTALVILTKGTTGLTKGTELGSQGAQELAVGAEELAGSADKGTGLAALDAGAQKVSTGASDLADGAHRLANGSTDLAQGVGTLSSALATAHQGSSDLTGGTKDLAAGADKLAAGVHTLAGGITQVSGAVSQASTGADKLADGTAQVAGGANELNKGLGTLAGGASDLAKGTSQLGDGANRLSDGANQLNDGTNQAAGGASDLSSGISQLKDGSSSLAEGLTDGAHQIPTYTDGESGHLSETASKPVTVTTNRLNEVPTYGHGLAPYFMALSLWVGAIAYFLMFPAITSSHVRPDKLALLGALRSYGRAALVALVQGMLMIGVLTVGLGLEVSNLGGLTLFIILTALTYYAINQALTALLGPPGRFIALVMAALQLASAGGTYPIETAPHFFQLVHPWLPLTYAVESFRSFIAGGDIGISTGILVMLTWAACALSLLWLATFIRQRKERRNYGMGRHQLDA